MFICIALVFARGMTQSNGRVGIKKNQGLMIMNILKKSTMKNQYQYYTHLLSLVPSSPLVPSCTLVPGSSWLSGEECLTSGRETVDQDIGGGTSYNLSSYYNLNYINIILIKITLISIIDGYLTDKNTAFPVCLSKICLQKPTKIDHIFVMLID